MKINKFPTISVVIPTFNSKDTIARCLSSIRKQSYLQKNIEIIIVDGGSKDNTKQIVSEFNIKWFSVPPKQQNVEFNKSVGIKKAKNELLLLMDHDNILPNKYLLKKMTQPFLEHMDLVGVETLRYYYDPKTTLLDRYFALFGVNDPLAFYLGKADRMSYIYDRYSKKYSPKDFGKYYLVTFKEGNIPTIGANGFMVRRNVLLKNADLRPGRYFPIDVNVDLIRKGFNKYAFVKDSIYHLSGHGSILNYLKRRVLFVQQYYLSKDSISLIKSRRYSLYEEKDFFKLVYFVAISITFIIPLLDSLRGYTKIRDKAWFLNPIICLGFVIMYGFAVIVHQFKIIFKDILGR